MDTQLKSPRPDNLIVACQNEVEVLKLVRLFGHLRRTEVARGIWPQSSPSVARKMAQRTVARLVKSRELFETSNALGGLSLVLGRSGAARLRNMDIEADAGYDLSSVNGGQFKHRSFGTRYLIERQAQGHQVFGEYALSKSWSPIGRKQFAQRFKKIPDGLVLVPGHDRGYDGTLTVADWIEVENTRKSSEDLQDIFKIAWKIGGYLDAAETLMLDRVVFVFDASGRHERRIKRALREYLLEHPPVNPALLSSITLCRCTVGLPFVWHGHEEVDCAELLRANPLPDHDSHKH